MKITIDKYRKQFAKNQASFEEIHKSILEGMDVHGSNFIILMCAIIIVSIGLNMNSVAVIIGAMLIYPLMSSIIGIGYGVGAYNVKLLKQAFKILSIAVVVSVITSTIYFVLSPIDTAGSEILARTRPTIWDVIIALVGGIAGMIGLTRNKISNVIPGVAIATALMPPLCTVGYGLATKQAHIFLGAGYLFFINGFFISVATLIVTKLIGIPAKQIEDIDEQRKIKKMILILSITITIPSIISAIGMIRDTVDETNLNNFIKTELKNQNIVSKSIDEKSNTITLVTLGQTITKADIQKLTKELSNYKLGNKKLVITQGENDISSLQQYIDNIKTNPNDITSNNTTTTNESLDFTTIFNELKSIYPDIDKIYVGYMDEEPAKENAKSIPIIVVYSKNKELYKNKDNLENWLKTRTNSNEATVYIEEAS